MFILDTDVLVDHLRGYRKAKDYVEQFEIEKLSGYISVISIIELFAGRKMKDQNEVDKVMELLNIFQKIDVNFNIAKMAGEFVNIYKCSIPDAIVASSAKILDLKIITRNKKHYEMIKEVEIKIPYK